MAGPGSETQFAQGTMGLGYPYTPVETRLASPMTLQPVDYSGISKALEGLPDALMKLNPAVRSQIQYQAALYDKGRANMQKTDQWSPYTTTFGATPQISPPSGQVLTNILPQTGGLPGQGKASAADDTKSEADKQVIADAQRKKSQSQVNNPPVYSQGVYSGGLNSVPQNQLTPTPVSPPRPPYKTSDISSPFTNYAQANPPSVDDYAISQVPGQVRATMPGGGVNPALSASTDTSQLVTQQAQQQPQAQPPSPVGDQLMAQWQNQNAHPVAPVSEALKWAKNNFDTRVQDATYLPHGGPMNQPSYAFHMKGGGTNMVPLSQMVQNGFAANVAGNQTSMTLSAADQQARLAAQQMQPTGNVGQQQMPQPAQGQQPQPMTPAGAPPPAPTSSGAQFAGADQSLAQGQNYLAQQTNVMTPSGETNPVLSADATAKQHAIANANRNGEDVHYDNPSNAPESTNGLHENPVLPEETKNADGYHNNGTPQPNQAVENSVKQTLDNVDQDYNRLPDANIPNDSFGLKVASVMDNNVKYFIDPSPGDSHIAFRLYSSPPWEQHRMYNDGKFTTTIVPNPEGATDKWLYDHGINTTGMNAEQKQAAMAERYYSDLPAYNLDGNEQRTLETLRDQVLQSQRLIKLTNVMKPEEHNWIRQQQQNIAGGRNQLQGIPVIGDWWRGLSDWASGGGQVNQRLSAFNTAWDALKTAEGSDDLTPGERGQLKGLDPQNEQFREKVVSINSDRMNQFVRYYDQMLANHKKGDRSWLDARNQIRTNGELADSQFIDVSGAPAARTGVNSANVRSARPAIPPNNNQDNPIDLSRLSQSDGEAYYNKLRGTKAWIRDADGVHQIQ